MTPLPGLQGSEQPTCVDRCVVSLWREEKDTKVVIVFFMIIRSFQLMK